MPEFIVNSSRLDPYKNYNFRVKWDGKYVAGISKISGLIRTTEVLKERDGGNPNSSYKAPGITTYNPIILERGVTNDTAFEEWANKVFNFGANFGQEVALADFRKNIIIEFYNEAGQLVIAYHVYRCWISEYQALPILNANDNEFAIQYIKLENEGWARDTSIVEPAEPSFKVT